MSTDYRSVDAKRYAMRRVSVGAFAAASAACVVASLPLTAGRADSAAVPIFGIELPPSYRDWRLIAVAHEEGSLNDLRAILGNDVAIAAARDGKLPFPDGTIIA